MDITLGIGSILGGLFAGSGQRSQNRFNAREAQKNRDWQKMMSDTTYTRARADMANAGYNPILGIAKPAPMGGGGQASSSGNPNEVALNSALAIERQQAEIDNIKAQTEFTKNKTDITQLGASVLRDAKQLYDAFKDYLPDGVQHGIGFIKWYNEQGEKARSKVKEMFNSLTDDLKKKWDATVKGAQTQFSDAVKKMQERADTRYIPLSNGKWWDSKYKREVDIATRKLKN